MPNPSHNFLISLQFAEPPPEDWQKHLVNTFPTAQAVLLGQWEPSVEVQSVIVPMPDKGIALTVRELQVLEDLAAGLTNKEIAQKRFIAAGTVHRHTRNVYQKLGVSSRTAAVVRGYAVKLLLH